MLLIKGRRESSVTTPHPAPLPKEGGSPYEAHHTVVGHHGPNPAGGKRAGTGGGDRLRRRGSSVVGPGESIQKAINAADPGDTIVVRGVHREDVVIRKNGIKLRGEATP